MNIEQIRSTAEKLVNDRRGAAITEYLIIVGLVAIICIAAYTEFGEAIRDRVEAQTGEINDI